MDLDPSYFDSEHCKQMVKRLEQQHYIRPEPTPFEGFGQFMWALTFIVLLIICVVKFVTLYL